MTELSVVVSLAALLLLFCFLTPIEALKDDSARMRQFHADKLTDMGPAPTTVFVVADWGGSGAWPYVTPYELTTAAAMDSLASQLPGNRVEAVFALGDNFYSYGVKSVEDQRFQTTFEAVFNGSRLRTVPWYLVAGNHDWLGNVSAQVLYTKRSSRWKFPDYFHTKVIQLDGIGCAAFILIDTVLLSESAASLHPDFHGASGATAKSAGKRPRLTSFDTYKYVNWLEEQLIQYNSCPYLFVAGHHPVWSIGHHGPTPDLIRYLDPLLLKYRVSAYLCGHEHNMQHIVLNNTDYFVAGAAAHVTRSTAHKHLFPKGSVRYYWNRARDLDGAFMTLSFGPDYANASFIEAGEKANRLYQVQLPRRHSGGHGGGLFDGFL